jgi:endonuclease/exonuclease/phosphatase family metal-dependent hydrolase
MTLKVATWNLSWLNRANGTGVVQRTDADYARLARYADLLAADVVAIQEVDGEGALRRVFDDAVYDFHLAGQGVVQRTGFAYRSTLQVTPNSDYAALHVGGLRAGADLTVMLKNESVRLLGVHLKAGCSVQSLSTPIKACKQLNYQLAALEAWIDARAAANEAFIVLGDFNRRMSTGEAFYTELDDGRPETADLTLATDGHSSPCWGGGLPQFVDHILLSREATPWLVPGSFSVLTYDAADESFKATLSDHCPVSISLTPGVSRGEPRPTRNRRKVEPSEKPPADAPIKGNINSAGRKLYHLANCPSYADTQIDDARGERFFVNEDEARRAGWRRAPNCP